MDKGVLGGLQLAGAVLIAGGALTGVAPVSLHSAGCVNGFGSISIQGGFEADALYACAQERSGRQLEAAGLLTLGGALLAGATYVRSGPGSGRSVPRGRTPTSEALVTYDADEDAR